MANGRKQVKSVVLGRTNYGEADLIVTFFTREMGLVTGIAKHARKSIRRFGNVLIPGYLVELDIKIKSGRELVILEKGRLVNPHENLCSDIRLLAVASCAIEMVGAFCAPWDAASDVFDLLTWYLDRIDQKFRPDEAAFIFMVKLLHITGFGPNVTECCVCGCVPAENSAEMNIESGGLVCGTCSPGGFMVSEGLRKVMYLIQTMPLDKLDRIRTGDIRNTKAGTFIMAYVRRIMGRELKSFRFLEQIDK